MIAVRPEDGTFYDGTAALNRYSFRLKEGFILWTFWKERIFAALSQKMNSTTFASQRKTKTDGLWPIGLPSAMKAD